MSQQVLKLTDEQRLGIVERAYGRAKDVGRMRSCKNRDAVFMGKVRAGVQLTEDERCSLAVLASPCYFEKKEWTYMDKAHIKIAEKFWSALRGYVEGFSDQCLLYDAEKSARWCAALVAYKKYSRVGLFPPRMPLDSEALANKQRECSDAAAKEERSLIAGSTPAGRVEGKES